MSRAFHGFDQVLGLLKSRSQSQVRRNRGDDESLSALRTLARNDPLTNQLVHCRLEGLARAPDFVLHHPNHVVIESKSRSHIMMLCDEAS